MPELHVLRVFTGQAGLGGNPLGVFLDGGSIPIERRQATAAALGFSETVFVDDRGSGSLQIFTPATELAFAGHPLVGTTWLLANEGAAVHVLRPPAGEVPVRMEGERALIGGRPEWAPEFRWFELASPAEVEALRRAPEGHDLGCAYAWIDERAGLVRARTFPTRLGIAEDEATGAAAVRLGAELGRDLEIRQGRGSMIEVYPRARGWVEVGGTVVLDEVREFPL